MSYAAEHATAYADVRAAGVVLAIARTAAGVEQPNGTFQSASPSRVMVAAFAKASAPDALRELGLVVERTVSLFVSPVAFPLRAYTAAFVMLNDTFVWNGVTMTVRAVGPLIALDGNVVACTIIGSV